VTGGSIYGSLTDLHGCININSLMDKGNIDTTTQNRLTRLFTILGIDDVSYQAIKDWMDDDLSTDQPDGAEDIHYLNIETPYRTANKPLYSITEVRLIKGFEDPENYRKLINSGAVCAFNGTDNANINVNTASAEVLQSLAPGMTNQLVQDIIDHRENTPFNDLNDFTGFSNLGTIIKGADRNKLSVSSDYFLLTARAVIGQANKVMYSIIHRDQAGKTAIISRSYRTL
jgi:general secretion pathway protein K